MTDSQLELLTDTLKHLTILLWGVLIGVCLHC